MSKIKCVSHNRRVHVLEDFLGPITIHRNDGSRCVVNPFVIIAGQILTPFEVIQWSEKKN